MQRTRSRRLLACLLHLTTSLAIALRCAAASEFTDAAKPPPVNEEKELVIAYFGGTNCAPCNAPGMKDAVRKAQTIFADRANASGKRFARLGVAVDTDLSKGVAFLDGIGGWDEIVVGRGFDNLASVDLLSGRAADQFLAIPQIVIYERTIRYEGAHLTATPPKVLGRFPGTGIKAWVDAGAKTD